MVWLPFFIFPYIGNNHPNWLSYFSEGWPNHQPVIRMFVCFHLKKIVHEANPCQFPNLDYVFLEYTMVYQYGWDGVNSQRFLFGFWHGEYVWLSTLVLCAFGMAGCPPSPKLDKPRVLTPPHITTAHVLELIWTAGFLTGTAMWLTVQPSRVTLKLGKTHNYYLGALNLAKHIWIHLVSSQHIRWHSYYPCVDAQQRSEVVTWLV